MTDAATHIRRLFLEPKDTYCVRDAAEILCMPLLDVLGWMEVGELEGMDTPHGLMLSWGELASFAMGFWSQESIEEALGADLAGAIRELLRLADLEVRIPRLEILALERLAGSDASPSTPSSPASCWMSSTPTRSTWPRRSRASPPRSGGRSRSAWRTWKRRTVSFGREDSSSQ
jgi:hypothetical protein